MCDSDLNYPLQSGVILPDMSNAPEDNKVKQRIMLAESQNFSDMLGRKSEDPNNICVGWLI